MFNSVIPSQKDLSCLLKFVLLLLIFDFGSLHLQATDINTWQVYNEKDKAFQPFTPKSHHSNLLHFIINPSTYYNERITIKVQESCHLFINHRYSAKINQGEFYLASNDLFKHTKGNKALLSLYNPKGFKRQVYTVFYKDRVQKNNIPNTPIIEKNSFIPLAIHKNFVRDKLLLFGLCILFFAAINYNKSYRAKIQSIQELIHSIFFYRESGAKISIFKVGLYLLFFSTVLTHIVVCVEKETYLKSDQNFIIYSWGLLLLLMVFQLAFVRLLSSLYQIEGLFANHLYEIVKIGNLWCLFMLFLICSWLMFPWSISSNKIKFVLIFSLFTRTTIIIYRLYKQLRFSNMYLFSYFCITEILPFIFIKYFIFLPSEQD